MKVSELKLSKKLANVLARLKIEDLDYLNTKCWTGTGVRLKPSEVLSWELRDLGAGHTAGLGIEAYKELFDSLLIWVIEQEEKKDPKDATTKRVNDQALSVLNTMISSSTGDFGGRDQTQLLAEIAFDYLDALAREERIRSTPPHQPPSLGNTPPAADSNPDAH